ncbi:hypothetical protein CBR_g54848 [Chara braunii]|uniref:Actin-binding transcription modulator n=1 Tax=Chara braunii TaxID=69332 RepID=A0A388JPM8_CHABU|nr:hypothetical protein CBR_g54848 [Chara braunii]|eukprot:GBG59745.1 hypothetical protein CBR_g54848 [Chara braunii]
MALYLVKTMKTLADSRDDVNLRLCIIGLAPSHFVFRDESKEIKSIDFNVGKGNRQEFKPSGKGKKDARFLMPNSGLCKLVFSNESFKTVRCCVRGSLLEVNSRLSDDPSLLMTKADSEGYIGIIMPTRHDGNQIAKKLLTKEQYMEKRGDLARLCQG